MGLSASQTRLLDLQSRKDSQETKDYLNALNKQALSTQQTELYNEYENALESSNNVTTEKQEINDTAEISKEAMALLMNDNIDKQFDYATKNENDQTESGQTCPRPKDEDIKTCKDDSTITEQKAKDTGNNTTVTKQKTAGLSATRARVINAYRRFAS